ncbi:hypothetical protein KSP40_PGU003266 [Platanthera guangdongensis]|uniref:Uncharacterized protein n=1 Tax=Platanthera guangdongensis TaxID=2320717 RepID=A0ABR2M7K8_9ASPA
MERRKKFHDALLKLYHPPSPPMPESHSSQASPAAEEQVPAKAAHIHIQSGADQSEELENEGCDSGSEKLTRARRKRIRRRKLKEEASSTRRKIIGPLYLPLAHGDAEVEPNNKEQIN